jgi:hypothetical protein
MQSEGWETVAGGIVYWAWPQPRLRRPGVMSPSIRFRPPRAIPFGPRWGRTARYGLPSCLATVSGALRLPERSPSFPCRRLIAGSTGSSQDRTAIPTAGSQPYGITTGPDGALWFTESGGNNIARAPACGLGLSAGFANGALTMSFSLGTSTPANWFGSLQVDTGGERQLWFKSIPAVVPPDSFTVTLGPGFANLGEVTIVSGLETRRARVSATKRPASIPRSDSRLPSPPELPYTACLRCLSPGATRLGSDSGLHGIGRVALD